jgi:hypothetical protein
MKNSLTRKGLAVASAVALAVAGFAAVAPANAYVAIDYAEFQFTESTNLFDEDTYVGVREGVKSVSFKAQIKDGSEDRALGGQRIKLEVSEDGLAEDSVITVSGASGNVTTDGGLINAYGTTNASGNVSFTVNSTTGYEDDDIYMEIYTWENMGWVYQDYVYLGWEEAYAEDMTVNENYIGSTADNVTLTYEIVDQFGANISKTSSDGGSDLNVSVVSVDYEDGYFNDRFTTQTKPVVGGKATFTVPNNATLGSYNSAWGVAHRSTVPFDNYDYAEDVYLDWDDRIWFTEITQIWKNGATNKVETDYDLYGNKVTYGFYEDDYAYIDIDVTFKDNSGEDEGAAYQPVTVSSSGLLFYDGEQEDYEDAVANSLVTKTDEDGDAYVYVFSKKENLNGKSITITSGGKSKTVVLYTKMNEDIYEDGGGVLKWNWKKVAGGFTTINSDGVKETAGAPAANTTYDVKVKARDIWGNKLRGAEVYVYDNTDGYGSADPYEEAVLRISGFDEDEDDNAGWVYTNSNGNGKFQVRAINPEYPNRKLFYNFLAELDYYEYDISDNAFFNGYEGYSTYFDGNFYGQSQREEKAAKGYTGRQAQVKRGQKKGVVRVGVYNAAGKSVQVYVGGKLVQTTKATKAKFVTKVTGVAKGSKRVTVWVGGKRLYTGSVTVR